MEDMNGETNGSSRAGAFDDEPKRRSDMTLKRPRVLFVSYTAETTGPTKSLTLLLRELRRDHDVAVLLPGAGGFSEALTGEGIPFTSLPSLNKWSIPRVFLELRRRRVDLVYSNDSQGGGRNACLAARLARVPFICHVRALGWNKRWAGSWHLRTADAVVAVSHACAASLPRFVPSDRVHVVHNGVPVREYTAMRDRASVRDEIGLPREAPVLLSVGHICRRKNQKEAIEAMAEIRRVVPSAHLCLAGWVREEDYLRGLEDLTRELDLEGSVHFLGFRSDVEAVMGAADLLVHTSSADPHPRAVLEAMSQKLPVVAFGVDGVVETVDHEETGLLVEPGDVRTLAEAAARVLTDRALARQLGEAGRQRVATHFSEVRTGEGVRKVIARVLAPTTGGSMAMAPERRPRSERLPLRP